MEEDKRARKAADARNKLEGLAYSLKTVISDQRSGGAVSSSEEGHDDDDDRGDMRSKMTRAEVERLNDAIDQVLQWLEVHLSLLQCINSSLVAVMNICVL